MAGMPQITLLSAPPTYSPAQSAALISAFSLLCFLLLPSLMLCCLSPTSPATSHMKLPVLQIGHPWSKTYTILDR